jgi:cytosine/uracil/thiamine/allantoin permease
VVTAGLSDFGLLGAFIYPMALAALCSALLRATRRLPDAVHLLVAVAMLNTLLNVEGSVADYFNIIRSLAIYLAMGWGAWWALCQVLGLHLMAPKMPRGAGGAQRSQVFMNAGFAWLAKLRRSGKTSAS